VAEYDARHYEEARAIFARAHTLYPNARTLRGLGMTCFELRDYVGAIRHLRASLRETRRPLTDEQRVHVNGLIERALSYVGTFDITTSPPDASLSIDGQPAQRETGGIILIGFGRHTLVASCSHCQSETRTIAVNGGERVSLTFALLPAFQSGEQDTPLPPALGTNPPGQPGTETSVHGGAPWGLWVAAGGAAALTGVSVFWWLNRSSELDRCREAGDACANMTSLESQKTLALTATIAAGAAAVTLTTVGLVWNLTSKPAAGNNVATTGKRAQLGCAPTLGAGFSCMFGGTL